MYKISVFLFVGCLMVTSLLAQKVKVVDAEKQPWSGGVAGRHGNNYNITLQFSGCKDALPVGDTLWIEQDCIVLHDDASAGVAYTIKRSGSKAVMSIHANVVHFDNDRVRKQLGGKEPVKTDPPFKYSGAGLLSYTWKGQKKYYTIKQFTKTQPPVAYP